MRSELLFKFFVSVALLSGSSGILSAQTASDQGILTGSWHFRHVVIRTNSSGVITRSRSMSGTVTFDGSGHFQANATLLDSNATTSGPQNVTPTGTYNVTQSGIGDITGLLSSTSDSVILVGAKAIVGSYWAPNYFDLFMAVPAGSSETNNTLNGTYQAGILDLLNADATKSRSGYFQIISDGQGRIAATSVSGSAVNVAQKVNQQVGAVSYQLDKTGAASVAYPVTGAAGDTILAGTKQLFVSADGDVIIGGDPAGYDFILAIRAPSGTVPNSYQTGTYYTALFQLNSAAGGTPNWQAQFGSVRRDAAGKMYVNVQSRDNQSSLQQNYTTASAIAPSGVADIPTGRAFVGAGGDLTLIVGTNPYYLQVWVRGRDYTAPAGKVFVHPYGVMNSSSYSPVTTPLSAGELVTLYGSGLAPATANAQGFPLPQTLAGVQVLVNGIAAPLSMVSAGRIDFIVPFEIADAESGNATIVVQNNGSSSQPVGYLIDSASPGVYTLSQDGSGDAVAVHSDYSLVTPSNPARPNETIALYLTGLGSPKNAVANGDAAPSSPLPVLTLSSAAVIGGGAAAKVAYAGLAPGWAGLYQMNITLPASFPSSNNRTDLSIRLSESGIFAQYYYELDGVTIPVSK